MDFNFQKNYDIVVAGAGVAGIAAALAAARRGHKVCLLEKQCLIGGLATSGLIYIYLPLCDGKGTQLTFGISEEMLKKSLEYSPFDIGEKFGGIPGGNATRPNRYAVDFSPAGFTLSLDELLLDAGVDPCLAQQTLDKDFIVCRCAVVEDFDGTTLHEHGVVAEIYVSGASSADAAEDAEIADHVSRRTQSTQS